MGISSQGGSQQAFQFSDSLFNSLGLGYGFIIACRRLSREAVFLSLLLPLFAFPLCGTFSGSPLPVGRGTARRT